MQINAMTPAGLHSPATGDDMQRLLRRCRQVSLRTFNSKERTDMTRTSRILGFVVLLSSAASPTMAAAPKTGEAPAADLLVAQAPAAPSRPGPGAAAVEGRIADLHKKLAITPEQEPQFTAYADVMRANAQAMEDLFRQRAQHRDMTAPGMLHWHAQLTTAHADALNKLLPTFDALYDGLSATQKKAADTTFQALRQGRTPRKAP